MKLKYFVLLLAFVGLSLPAAARDVTLVFSSPADFQMEQVVEIDYQQLLAQMQVAKGTSLRVVNGFGQDVDYQVTHDGKFLVYVAVRPGSETKLTVKAGKPKTPQQNLVGGKYYPNREEDIAWENDRCAYRVYGPELQRSGEKAYGVDIWSKNVPTRVVDNRYLWNMYVSDYGSKANRLGHKEIADSVWLMGSFHLDHGDGLDAYAVGPSLGCGTPALVKDGKLVFPYCYKTFRILDNGPLRFTLELTFGPKNIDGIGSQVTEHRIISLDRGMNFNRCEVWYENVGSKTKVAAGVVVHQADTRSVLLKPQMVLYADPTDRPDRLGSQVYVGALFPYNNKVDARLIASQENKDIAGNAVGIIDYRAGEHWTYYFGSAWSSYDVRTFREWQLRAEETLQGILHPITCRMQ